MEELVFGLALREDLPEMRIPTFLLVCREDFIV